MAVELAEQKKLADILDVSATMVGLWCNQKTEPSADMLSKLSKIFNKPEKEIQKIFDLRSNNVIIGDKNQQNISDTSLEFNKLKKENDLLKNENILLKKQIEILKDTIKLLELKNKEK